MLAQLKNIETFFRAVSYFVVFAGFVALSDPKYILLSEDVIRFSHIVQLNHIQNTLNL